MYLKLHFLVPYRDDLAHLMGVGQPLCRARRDDGGETGAIQDGPSHPSGGDDQVHDPFDRFRIEQPLGDYPDLRICIGISHSIVLVQTAFAIA